MYAVVDAFNYRIAYPRDFTRTHYFRRDSPAFLVAIAAGLRGEGGAGGEGKHKALWLILSALYGTLPMS